MAAELTLRHHGGSTRIIAGDDALDLAESTLEAWIAGRKVFLLTSSTVAALWEATALSSLGEAASLERLPVPDGEAAKRLSVASEAWAEMVRRGGERGSRLIALGGGSTTDLGGFVAAGFHRGIECVLLPTTLLGQVDAAIGGKTGVDLDTAKNVVGLFHHPQMVVADTRFLSSLPSRELVSGLVEVVKIAAACDADLFDRLENDLESLVACDQTALAKVIPQAIQAKVRVVEDDPDDGDRRRLLNMGHTLGHALETLTGYRGLRHGEAVAWGLLFVLQLARRRGATPDWADRVEGLLARIELPPLPTLQTQDVLEIIARDKKVRQGQPVWILPMAPGEAQIVEDLDPELVREELNQFLG